MAPNVSAECQPAFGLEQKQIEAYSFVVRLAESAGLAPIGRAERRVPRRAFGAGVPTDGSFPC
ncbi:MAG: hypothetical protein JWO62_958 [Acidimicrobiaceae bacterium]|nr:hypothetical protein [Acidimicrobiaceae bacterium]